MELEKQLHHFFHMRCLSLIKRYLLYLIKIYTIIKKIEKNISFYNWDHLKELIPSNNVIVNCTTLGWGEYENISPIEEKLISKASQNSVFFDVIYQPKETLFLRYCRERGYETMNGEDMNFIQAVLAFNNTIKMFDKKFLRNKS